MYPCTMIYLQCYWIRVLKKHLISAGRSLPEIILLLKKLAAFSFFLHNESGKSIVRNGCFSLIQNVALLPHCKTAKLQLALSHTDVHLCFSFLWSWRIMCTEECWYDCLLFIYLFYIFFQSHVYHIQNYKKSI